jgi:hypothetical protein
MTTDETTPLLQRPDTNAKDTERVGRFRALTGAIWRGVHVETRILLAGFLITLSFSFTQVP